MKKIVAASSILIALAIYFYFIPAFRGDIRIVASFVLGPLTIKWYGLTMALSILTGYLVACKYSWKFGIDKREVESVAFWLVIAGILGARLYFVLFSIDYFRGNWTEIYKIWHGGLSIYGALIAGGVFLWFYARNKAYRPQQLFDLVALSLPLPQALGRLGNFFNQEAYGVPTDLPWKMYVKSTDNFHHPAFLYEALASIVIFFVLLRLLPKLKPGSLAAAYVGFYSLARFFIEPIREDSFFIANFRVDQLTAFLLIVFSVLVFYRINFILKSDV